MTLNDKIMVDLKTAMRTKDKNELEAIRAIKNAILLAKTEKGGSDELTPEAEIQLLQKLVKQRKEAADIYLGGGREELAHSELAQAEVIQRYLPAQMSKEDVEKEVAAIIAQTGAKDMKDMGKVMGAASKALAGKADNKVVSEIVKALLQN